MRTAYKEINLEEGKNAFMRKAKVIKEIALVSTQSVLEDSKAYGIAGTVGLMQGLKYNGSIKRGTKAGVATMGVMVGTTIMMNVVKNIDVIKQA